MTLVQGDQILDRGIFVSLGWVDQRSPSQIGLNKGCLIPSIFITSLPSPKMHLSCIGLIHGIKSLRALISGKPQFTWWAYEQGTVLFIVNGHLRYCGRLMNIWITSALKNNHWKYWKVSKETIISETIVIIKF